MALIWIVVKAIILILFNIKNVINIFMIRDTQCLSKGYYWDVSTQYHILDTYRFLSIKATQ